MYEVDVSLPKKASVSAMFADFVLDLVDHLATLENATFIESNPFSLNAAAAFVATPVQRLAVDGMLGLLRQPTLKGEDIYFEKIFEFFNELPLSQKNKQFYRWFEQKIREADLPTLLEVETTAVSVLEQCGNYAVLKDDGRCLSATPRYVAALRLYGKLLHRQYPKRRHLGGLLNACGPQFVFEYSGKYAEHTAWLYVNLAVLWLAHEEERELSLPRTPSSWLIYPTETLQKLTEFLARKNQELDEASPLRWSIPF